MSRTRIAAVVAAAVSIGLLSGCGLDLQAGLAAAQGKPVAPQSAAPAQGNANIEPAAVNGLGAVLADQGGKTLYLFTKDKKGAGTSACDGDCAELWPPLLAEGEVRLEGVDQELLGTAKRSDGTTQVTIGGWPAYRYAGDEAPGDTNGHGIGGVWFALGKTGEAMGELPDLEAPGEQTEQPQPQPQEEEQPQEEQPQPEQPQEEQPQPEEEQPEPQEEQPADTTTKVSAADIDGLGKVLVDQDGRTLYLFTKDKKNSRKSVCDGECAELWPPLLAEGKVELEGVDEKLLGTAKRSDGTTQVTVGGWPLYRYAKDKAPGDATGHNVGGVWFTVETNGCKVSGKKKPTGESSESSESGGSGYTY
jgi:predicted lipoprotein with Yx(FWY)xxD motif